MDCPLPQRERALVDPAVFKRESMHYICCKIICNGFTGKKRRTVERQ